MLKIITSKSGKLLKKSILDIAMEYYNANKRLFIVVPETFTYSTDFVLLEYLKVEAVIDVKVVSFQRLTQMFLAKNGGAKKTKIDDIGKSLIVRKIIIDNPEYYSMYKNVADQEGFLSMVVNFVGMMKSNMIEGKELVEFSANNVEDSILKKKLFEIGNIFIGLEDYLINKYVDNEDRLNQFLETIDQDTHYMDEDFVFFEFAGFSKQEYEIISKIIRKNSTVTVGLLHSNDCSQIESVCFDSTQETFFKLKKLAEDNHVELEIETTESELDDKSYKLINELYPEDEIRSVCSYINRIAYLKGSYENIGVVLEDDSYRYLIKKIFDEYGIPYFVNTKSNLIYTPVARWILSILDSVIYGFKFEDVFEFLKLNINPLEISSIEIFENFVLRRNIVGDMYFRDKYFDGDNFHSDSERNIVMEVIEYLRNGFKEIKKLRKKKFNPIYITKTIFETFECFGFNSSLEEFIFKLEEKGLSNEAEVFEQSYGAFVEIVEQMVEILGEKDISLEEFKSLLEVMFRQKKLSIIPQRTNEITIDSFKNGMPGNFDYIFILGANSENIPNLNKEKSLLNENEIKLLEQSKFDFFTEEIRLKDNHHNIYRVIDKARIEVIFSFSRIGIDGKKSKQSKYINYYNAEPINKNKEWGLLNDPQLFDVSNIISKYLEIGEITENEIDLLAKVRNSECLNNISNIIFKSMFFGDGDFKISDAISRLLYKEPLIMSVTRIQELSKCQFSHFIKYGLRARERDVSSIESKELGTLLHGFVEDFVDEIQKDRSILEMDENSDIKSFIEKQYDIQVEKQISEDLMSSTRNKYLISKLKKSALTLGDIVIKQLKSAAFVPKWQEITFKDDGKIKPLLLNDLNYDVKIEGVIDRVDFYSDGEKAYFCVIDYKSNGKEFSISNVYNGIDNQLMIYSAAILDSNEDTNIAGVFYMPLIEKRLGTDDVDINEIEKQRFDNYALDGIAISESEVLEKIDVNYNESNRHIKLKGRGGIENKTNLLSEKEFYGLIDHVKKNVSEKVEELIKGDVLINPYVTKSKTSCDYCNYKSICKVDIKWNKEKFNTIGEFSAESIKSLLGGEE